MAGIGRELIAANVCVEKQDVATACEHWSIVLEITKKLGPRFDENRIGLEELISENDCANLQNPAED